jgi:hypothetical protein
MRRNTPLLALIGVAAALVPPRERRLTLSVDALN